MPPEPRVSLITAVRDGARTIAATLASVRAQTEPDWEHLVIDDGSTDATPALVAAAADPRLRYVRQSPQGASAARNRGLALARGACLLFLDADDWLLPHALRAHLDHLDRHPACGVSVADGHFCRDDGTPIASFSARRGPIPPPAGLLAGLLVNPGLVAAPVAVMVRAQIVRTHGIRFDPELTLGEDSLFWIEVARHARFGFLDTVTCGYRWHAGNTSLRSTPDERRRAYAQLASKVLAAPYFAPLPAGARAAFLQRVLIDALGDDVEAQQRLIASPAFTALPPATRARLLRLAASEHLIGDRAHAAAGQWLRAARRLAPRDPIAHVLALLLAVHPRLVRLAIRVRRRQIPTVADPLWQHGAGSADRPATPASPTYGSTP